MRFLALAPAVLALLLSSACADPPSAAQGAARPAPNDTLVRIRALAASPSCSEDSQCHSLALGARPCGGPEGYLAWSSVRTPPEEIRALGQLYQAERKAANEASGVVSDCRYLPDPGAVCRAGACQLGEAGSALPAR